MDQYLHANSHHHPSQKRDVLNTLITRAIRISEEDHLQQEKQHLHDVFLMNVYSRNR